MTQHSPLILRNGKIVDLKIKEIGHSEVNCVKYLEHSYDSFLRTRKVGSLSRPLGFELLISLQVLTRNKEFENSRMMSCDALDLEADTSKNNLKDLKPG